MSTHSCYFCKKRIEEIDWRHPDLSRFLTLWAKIKKRNYSRNCAKHQRQLAKAVKTARVMALLPYVSR